MNTKQEYQEALELIEKAFDIVENYISVYQPAIEELAEIKQEITDKRAYYALRFIENNIVGNDQQLAYIQHRDTSFRHTLIRLRQLECAIDKHKEKRQTYQTVCSLVRESKQM